MTAPTFYHPLPTSTHDVEFFKKIIELGTWNWHSVTASLLKPSQGAAMAHALQAAIEVDDVQTSASNFVKREFPFCNQFNSVEFLAPAGHDKSEPMAFSAVNYNSGPPSLSPVQQSLHERMLFLFCSGGQESLDLYLAHAAKFCTDPVVFEDILAAGADIKKYTVGASLQINGNQTCQPAMRAFSSANACAFFVLKSVDADIFKNQIREFFGNNESPDQILEPLSAMLHSQTSPFSGLHALKAVEDARDLDRSLSGLTFRVKVIEEYLGYSAKHGIAWNENVIRHLLGEPAPLAKSPSSPNELATRDERVPDFCQRPTQQKKIPFDSLELLPTKTIKTLISRALQTHCWPILEKFEKTLRHMQEERVIPLPTETQPFPGANNVWSSTQPPVFGTALAAMLTYPGNDAVQDQKIPFGSVPWFNPEKTKNFDRTLSLLESFGLIENELENPSKQDKDNAVEATGASPPSSTMSKISAMLKISRMSNASKVSEKLVMRTSSIPGIHQLALKGGPSKYIILSHLIKMNFEPHIKDEMGRDAADLLTGENKEKWQVTVRSALGKQAAEKALQEIKRSPSNSLA